MLLCELACLSGVLRFWEYLRFKVVIQQNVVAVELKAVFVIYDDLLYALETAHEYVIDLLKHGFYHFSAMFCRQVSSKLLHLPLTPLCRDTVEGVR